MAQKMLTEAESKGRKRPKKITETVLSEDIKAYLRDKYYDLSQPGSFSGTGKFWQSIKNQRDAPPDINSQMVKSWLEKEEVYEIHKAPQKVFQTEMIITGQVSILL